MTKEEATKLKEFDHHCTCGGYAWAMNDRKEGNPHLSYCPQKAQYEEWYKALNS